MKTGLWAIAFLLMFVISSSKGDVRIKDITSVLGNQANTLTGVGLVAGLNGTGGKNPETRQFALNFLERSGLRANPELRLAIRNDTRQKTKSLSVVALTAELPVTARVGQQIDVTVSTLDDATNLEGGVLIMTPLVGVDGNIYATARGPVTLGGGFSAGGQAASVQKNHPTAGRIVGGARVQAEVPSCLAPTGELQFLLNNPDFSTAKRITEAINQVYVGTASALDSGTVNVVVPPQHRQALVEFIAIVGQQRVKPDAQARVVINERTGTVVIGQDVRLSQVAITHGNLAVTTSESPTVSQPLPQSRGQTAIVPRTEVDVVEDESPVNVIDETATVSDLVQALNALGVTPRDLSAIFQGLKTAGALHADLEFQ